MKSTHSVILSFLVVATTLLTWGCETTVDFKPNSIPKLTINSQITPFGRTEDKQVYVYATQSPSDSTQFFTPVGTEVTITRLQSDTIVHLTAMEENGKVFFQIPEGFLKAGKTYRIDASAPDFESVSATTKIPEPSTIKELGIKTISIEQSELNDFKKNIRYTIQFKINHAPGNEFYHLVFYNSYEGMAGTPAVNPELSDNQPFIHDWEYGVLLDRADLKDDQLLTFNFVDWSVNGHDLNHIYVELRSVTEEYYKYQSTLARQLIVRQDPFAEPVSIFNNIDGGYGNFSAFAMSFASSDLPN